MYVCIKCMYIIGILYALFRSRDAHSSVRCADRWRQPAQILQPQALDMHSTRVQSGKAADAVAAELQLRESPKYGHPRCSGP